MSIYDPLKAYLKTQHGSRIPMTFSEIERIIGRPLPHSARAYRPWWSNNPDGSVVTNAWLRAGFKTEQVDMAGEKLVFSKTESSIVTPGKSKPDRNGAASSKPTHEGRPSYFGAMKGTLKIDPSLDLTEPADPEWGKVYEDD